MKKIFLFLLVFLQLLVLPAIASGKQTAAAPSFSLTALAGRRDFSSADFRKIYDGSQLAFGLDLGYRLGKKFAIFISGQHLSATGELSYSKETTSFRLISLEGGARLALPMGRFVPYAGAGAGYYLIREENVIATMDEKKAGFFALGGLRFHFSKAFFAAAQVKFVSLELKPLSKSVDLGGWFAGGGIGVMF
ncbi:MAG: porin family protein [Acidobacteria bacterium]|nr:porin family protein [Acidobacteriota bacterium]MBU4307871.1 porin family protein [Acidobacteriota bacterium]MBU4405195.1 porin family protein [Acidobacteriota bacterium]MCG2811009.1 porin family protein [Candidatus Aminicenantes bacterium]